MNLKRYDLRYRSIIVVFLSVVSYHAIAQQLSDYRQQRKILTKHIKMLDASLQGKQKQKNSISKNYELLAQKIKKREELQNSIQSQLSAIDSVILTTDSQLSDMYIRQQILQKQSDELVRQNYYRKKQGSIWLSILSKRNLERMLIEWRRNAQLSEHINQKMSHIETMRSSIRDTIDYLSEVKNQKIELIQAEDENLYTLQQEYEQSNTALKQLSSEEKVIRQELIRQQQESDRLSRVISGLIKKEIAAKPVKRKADFSTSFGRSKGKISWPVNEGVVTSSFGIRRHPTLPNVKMQNHGIDMLCPASSRIAAIHGGEVLIVTVQQPYDHVVIVSHGDYVSAYYYLSEVSVQKGDKVNAGQVIGRLSSEGDNQTFHFEIWHQQKQINPEKWLSKRK